MTTTTPYLLNRNDVNLINLSLALEAAAIEHSLHEDYLCITERSFFPMTVRVNSLDLSVDLHAQAACRPGVAPAEQLGCANAMNAALLLPRCAVNGQVLEMYARVPFDDGLIQENFLHWTRYFQDACSSALREYDPQQALFQVPEQGVKGAQ